MSGYNNLFGSYAFGPAVCHELATARDAEFLFSALWVTMRRRNVTLETHQARFKMGAAKQFHVLHAISETPSLCNSNRFGPKGFCRRDFYCSLAQPQEKLWVLFWTGWLKKLWPDMISRRSMQQVVKTRCHTVFLPWSHIRSHTSFAKLSMFETKVLTKTLTLNCFRSFVNCRHKFCSINKVDVTSFFRLGTPSSCFQITGCLYTRTWTTKTAWRCIPDHSCHGCCCRQMLCIRTLCWHVCSLSVRFR